MRVYVGVVHHGRVYSEVGEVFVNENDAKGWVADMDTKVHEEELSFDYVPRDLRTAWNG